MYICRAYQSPCSGTHWALQCAQMPNFASRNHSGHPYRRRATPTSAEPRPAGARAGRRSALAGRRGLQERPSRPSAAHSSLSPAPQGMNARSSMTRSTGYGVPPPAHGNVHEMLVISAGVATVGSGLPPEKSLHSRLTTVGVSVTVMVARGEAHPSWALRRSPRSECSVRGRSSRPRACYPGRPAGRPGPPRSWSARWAAPPSRPASPSLE